MPNVLKRGVYLRLCVFCVCRSLGTALCGANSTILHRWLLHQPAAGDKAGWTSAFTVTQRNSSKKTPSRWTITLILAPRPRAFLFLSTPKIEIADTDDLFVCLLSYCGIVIRFFFWYCWLSCQLFLCASISKSSRVARGIEIIVCRQNFLDTNQISA